MNRLFALYLYVLVYAKCQEQMDVMKVTNVTFPYSGIYPALLNASYPKEIAEFTICFRFYIESYNDGWIYLLHSKTPDLSDHYFYDAIGLNKGLDREGFHGARSYFRRNVWLFGIFSLLKNCLWKAPSFSLKHFFDTVLQLQITRLSHITGHVSQCRGGLYFHMFFAKYS